MGLLHIFPDFEGRDGYEEMLEHSDIEAECVACDTRHVHDPDGHDCTAFQRRRRELCRLGTYAFTGPILPRDTAVWLQDSVSAPHARRTLRPTAAVRTLSLADLPEVAMKNIGSQLRLKDVARLARTGSIGRTTAEAGKVDAAIALLHRVRRSPYPAPYIYRYEGDYDPNVPDPGANAGVLGHNFTFVQALEFQNTEHSNPTFPQSWSPAGSQRLTPVIVKELHDKMMDRGVGGPPYIVTIPTNGPYSVSSPTHDPYITLPLDATSIPMVVGGVAAWTAATIPRNFSGHLPWIDTALRHYDIPMTLEELAQSGVHNDGVLLYEAQDMVDVAIDPQIHAYQPALMHRYQITTDGRPVSGLAI
jgi:hypothetical protein